MKVERFDLVDIRKKNKLNNPKLMPVLEEVVGKKLLERKVEDSAGLDNTASDIVKENNERRSLTVSPNLELPTKEGFKSSQFKA